MNLDDTQKQTVRAWIEDGQKLAEIQKRLGSQFGLQLTYMEVRLLVDDLKLVPKDPEPAAIRSCPPRARFRWEWTPSRCPAPW
jgi:transposase